MFHPTRLKEWVWLFGTIATGLMFIAIRVGEWVMKTDKTSAIPKKKKSGDDASAV